MTFSANLKGTDKVP